MKRIAYLDGLRGLAVLVVVLHHFMLAFYPAIYGGYQDLLHTNSGVELLIYRTPLNIFFNGNFAVFLFIILSGFVLSLKYFQDKKAIDLVSIGVKRYFRLMPPILVGNILAFIILLMGFNYNLVVAPITRSESWLGSTWALEPNIGLMAKQSLIDVYYRITTRAEAYNTSLWTIPMFFLGTYIVLGFLGFFGRFKWRTFAYLAVILLIIKTHYYPFIIGVALCDWFTNRLLIISPFKQVLAVVGLGVSIYLGSYPSDITNMAGTIYGWLPVVRLVDEYSFYHITGATMMILSLFYLPGFQRILSAKLMLFMGKVSYSLYIIHAVIIYSLGCYLFLKLNPLMGYNLAVFWMLVIILPIIIVMASLLYKAAEEPGIKLSNWIWNKLVK